MEVGKGRKQDAEALSASNFLPRPDFPQILILTNFSRLNDRVSVILRG